MKGFEDFFIIKMLIVNVFFKNLFILFKMYWFVKFFPCLYLTQWMFLHVAARGVESWIWSSHCRNVRFVPDIKMLTNCVFLFCFMLFLFYTFAPFGLLSELNCISTYQKCMYFKVIVKAECNLFPCSVWIYEQKKKILSFTIKCVFCPICSWL